MPKGGCHCGAVRYEMPAEAAHAALCHCSDCRRHSGAPMVMWGLVAQETITITGEVGTYASSEQGRRQFCPACGTSLFYLNETIFPGMIDVQTATLDYPNEIAPTAQIQTAERIGWMEGADALPAFERYPPV